MAANMGSVPRSESRRSEEISNIDDDNNWRVAVEEGNIDSLYKLIQKDSKVLDKFDANPFVQTPLHDAATTQHLQFAAEIMRLKPSLAFKPNHEGWCPIHLALLQENEKMVRRFVDMNKELAGASGKEGLTPLHLAAKLGKTELIDKLLGVFPNSIENVTVRSETALHIALQFQQFDVFKSMLIWLRKNTNKGASRLEKTVLNWKDDAGNTVLHLSAKMDKFQQVRMLRERKVNLNQLNAEKESALDLACSEEVKKILTDSGALRGEAIMKDFGEPAIPKIFEGWLIRRKRVRNDVTEERLNAFLVVATLVATATYQTAISPPGGVLQAEGVNVTNNTTKLMNRLDLNPHLNWTEITYTPQTAGHSVMPSFNFFVFSCTNMISFLASTFVIFALLPKGLIRFLLFLPTFLLQWSFLLSIWVVSPSVIAKAVITFCFVVLQSSLACYVFVLDYIYHLQSLFHGRWPRFSL